MVQNLAVAVAEHIRQVWNSSRRRGGKQDATRQHNAQMMNGMNGG